MSGVTPAPLRALIPILLAACACALVPAAAQADPYTIDYCRNFDTGVPAATMGLVTIVGGGGALSECGDVNNKGLGLAATTPTNPLPAPADVGVAVEIPPGAFPNLHLTRVQSLYFWSIASGGAVKGGMVSNDTNLLISRDVSGSYTDDFPLPAGTRKLSWLVHCNNAPCQFPAARVMTIVRNRFTLDEATAPTLTITGGDLVSPGVKAGQLSLLYEAHDTDSGVASVTATLDGVVVGATASACPHDNWSACPLDVVGQTLIADTTKVGNGPHALVVTARDAANNPVAQTVGTITTDNVPGPGTPNGTGAAKPAKLAVAFTTTAKRSRRLHFTATATARGTLADQNGQPIGGAIIAVLARQNRSGARTGLIGTVQSAADGTFSYTIPSGSSRTITFAYTAFKGDPTPAAIAALKTTVRAVVSARAPRAVRAGGRMTLSGRLTLLPRKGVQVSIQARDGRLWRTVDAVRTTKTGAFRWRYRFKPSSGGRTFAFRARVASPIYPFAAGNSKALTVRVR